MVVCAAINLERTSNLSSKVAAVVITLLFNSLENYIILKTDFNDGINFLALYWKFACVGPILFKIYSQNVFI